MPQNRSIIIFPPLDSEGGGGIRLSALVPRNHLDFTAVPVLAFGDVQMPHAVIDQLVSASLKDTC